MSLQFHQMAAVVVVFHPDDLVPERMATYSAVGKLMVYCNSVLTTACKQTLLQQFPQLIFLNHEGRNMGIGKALNAAATLALHQGYEYLLTMDQDSDFGDQFSAFAQAALHQFHTHAPAALIGPLYGSAPAKAVRYQPATLLITSGCIHRLHWWQKAGGYLEDWLIDEVDHEFGYRLQKLGARLYQDQEVRLTHQLGKAVQAADHTRVVYGPLRTFFSVRNYLSLRSKYGADFPDDFKMRNRIQRRQYLNNVLYSGQAWPVLQAIAAGWMAYRKGDFSKQLAP